MLIAMHDSEDASKGSVLYERIEMFAEFQVTKFFGLSLADYMELPTDVCSKILEISAKRQKVEGSVTNSMLSQLEAGKKDTLGITSR